MHKTNSGKQALSGKVIAMALRRNPRLISGLKAKLLSYIVLSKDKDDKFYMISESKMVEFEAILKSATYECFGRCHYWKIDWSCPLILPSPTCPSTGVSVDIIMTWRSKFWNMGLAIWFVASCNRSNLYRRMAVEIHQLKLTS